MGGTRGRGEEREIDEEEEGGDGRRRGERRRGREEEEGESVFAFAPFSFLLLHIKPLLVGIRCPMVGKVG